MIKVLRTNSMIPNFLNVRNIQHTRNLKSEYCQVSQWQRHVSGLVIGFINNPHVVTTINYFTIAALQNVQLFHTDLFSIRPCKTWLTGARTLFGRNIEWISGYLLSILRFILSLSTLYTGSRGVNLQVGQDWLLSWPYLFILPRILQRAVILVSALEYRWTFFT